MSADSFAALECRVGLGRVSVATEAIEMLGEYAVGTRLPLTDRLSYAVGIWGDDVVLSLALTRATGAATRTTSGLLLAVPESPIRWAFEIGSPVGLVDIASLATPQSTATRWLRTANLTGGGAIQFVDVRALIGDLAALGRDRIAR
jgi:hypothetical protein